MTGTAGAEPRRPAQDRPAWTRESAALVLPQRPALDITPAWAFDGATGRGVRVAVVDSGIEADHPALEGCVDERAGAAVEIDARGEAHVVPGPHEDQLGHGTACAGIVHELAPEATVVSVRVLGRGLAGKGAALLAGLRWAVEQRFELINVSLGTTQRDWALALHELCDEAYFEGLFVVTAANNVAKPTFPALYSSVTSVACSLTDDPRRFHANPRPPTEFLARGVEVDVPWAGGGRFTATGNSYAAPHLAGLAALVRSKHPGLPPFALKTVLWATAANAREEDR